MHHHIFVGVLIQWSMTKKTKPTQENLYSAQCSCPDNDSKTFSQVFCNCHMKVVANHGMYNIYNSAKTKLQ